MSARGKMKLFRLVNIRQALRWGFILFLTVTLGGNATAQICVPPPAGLVGWWPLDGNASDIVSGKHGAILGGTFVDGQVGQAFQLSAFGHGIQVQDVDIPEEFTIEAWIFPNGEAFFGTPHPGPGPIAEFFNAVSFFQHPSETNLHVALRDTAGVITTATDIGMVFPNAWNHVVLTYSKSTGVARFYRNGVETGSNNFGSLSLVPSADFYIGHRAPGSYDQIGVTYNGVIDEVGIYQRVLSAQEIQSIFNAGGAGKCKAPSLLSNGSFEQGANPGPSFITLPAGSTALTNWVVTRGTVDYIGPYWTAAAGQRSVDLNGNDPGAISQAFKTKPGTTYAVRFAMAGNPDGPPTTKRLQVSTGGESAELTFNNEGRSRQDMGYEKRTVLFTATSPQTTLAFTTLSPGPFGPAIDDVTVNETALGNVDNLVRFTPESRSYRTTTDVTGCPSGFVGKFLFTATLGAKPTSPLLSSLLVKVAHLSNGNLMQNADGGPSGVGGLLTIPRDLDPSYNDGVLTPGEMIQHIPFTICLTSKASFTFFVDVLATTGK